KRDVRALFGDRQGRGSRRPAPRRALWPEDEHVGAVPATGTPPLPQAGLAETDPVHRVPRILDVSRCPPGIGSDPFPCPFPDLAPPVFADVVDDVAAHAIQASSAQGERARGVRRGWGPRDPRTPPLAAGAVEIGRQRRHVAELLVGVHPTPTVTWPLPAIIDV